MTPTMHARAVALALLFAGAPAAAGTVRFDALEPRTVVTDQLAAQGVTFQPFEGVTLGVVEENYMGKVASFSYARSMEFPPWGARGSFTVGHKELHLHVAVAQKWGPTEMILTAYDRNGRVIAKSHMMITPASGFDNELQVQSPSADIIAFTLEAPYGVNTGPPLLYDLVFDDPPVMDLGGVDAAVTPPVAKPTMAKNSATATVTATATATATATDERGAWLERLLLVAGILLLLALGYFLWRSR
jgi:hypothetical protein